MGRLTASRQRLLVNRARPFVLGWPVDFGPSRLAGDPTATLRDQSGGDRLSWSRCVARACRARPALIQESRSACRRRCRMGTARLGRSMTLKGERSGAEGAEGGSSNSWMRQLLLDWKELS